MNKIIHYFLMVLISGVVLFSCKVKDSRITSWDVTKADSLSYLDSIHLCTELIPDSLFASDATKIDTSFFKKSNGEVDSVVQYIGSLEDKSAAAISIAYVWNHPLLKIKFLDGDPAVIERVKNSARQWENTCGIRFDFGDHPDPDISISFQQRGSWSYIGSYSKKMSPSMNLGWLNLGTSDEEVNRVVLHEFGHALGMIHEHLSPAANIKWNKEKVYKYYERPPNRWSRAMVDANIFNKYAAEQINASEFDNLSIMLYEIPKQLTTDGSFTTSNTTLSELDKKFMRTIYP